MIVNWFLPLCLILVGLILFALAYHFPEQALKCGCWLASWAEARIRMRRIHFRRYAAMKAERTPVPEDLNFEQADRVELQRLFPPVESESVLEPRTDLWG